MTLIGVPLAAAAVVPLDAAVVVAPAAAVVAVVLPLDAAVVAVDADLLLPHAVAIRIPAAARAPNLARLRLLAAPDANV
jgi:hypothetical protein